MIRGIIFDLDGTLLDTIADLREAVNRTMREYGFPEFTDAEVKQKVGNGNVKLIERCLPEGEGYLLDEAVEKFYGHYADCFLDETRPYPGVFELLKKLDGKGIRLAVNTNKQYSYCEELIRKNFPGIHFELIIGSRENIPNKPDPYSANEILEKLALLKKEALYIGDSEVDMKTAKNAGLLSVWVSWGFRTYGQVRDLEPDYCIDLPEQLLKYL